EDIGQGRPRPLGIALEKLYELIVGLGSREPVRQGRRCFGQPPAMACARCSISFDSSAIRTCPPFRKSAAPERRPRPDFTLYAPLRAEQIRSNTSRASAIDSKDGCGFRPALDPLPE